MPALKMSDPAKPLCPAAAEWALIELLLPKPHARGRPRRWSSREILTGIFYGCVAGFHSQMLQARRARLPAP